MPRDLTVGNGNLLINFDESLNIRDNYYPYVGKANHTSRCTSKTGIWVDGRFSWLDSPTWKKEMQYVTDSLTTKVLAINQSLMLRVVINDTVDFYRDLFLRRVEVSNLSSHPREIRIFSHYDFQFWEIGRGDSIQYHPNGDVLIAYKDDCYFLMNASLGNDIGLADWTTGNKDEKGSGSSWPDAEDGVLEKTATSFGAVDGVFSVHKPDLGSDESSVFYTWLAAARDMQGVRFLDVIVRERKPQFYLDRTQRYWQAWVSKEDMNFFGLPEEVVDLYKRSLLIIRTQVDNRGGIVAGNDSDFSEVAHGFETYSYVWPRDGAYVANALDKAGYGNLSERFYEFCNDVIHTEQLGRLHQIPHNVLSYMLHKYTPDRVVASNWMPLVDKDGNQHLPIQEDETALIPYCIWRHWLKFRRIESINPWYRTLVIQTGKFMAGYRDTLTRLPAPSFDLWEEGRAIYSFTTSTVWAGLHASANFAEMFGDLADAERFRIAANQIKEACETYLYDENEGRFLKSISVQRDGSLKPDYNVDASLYGLWYFGMFEPSDARIERTMDAIVDRLSCRTEVGGLARYEGDMYHWDSKLDSQRGEIPGNPWIICTLWLAQYHIARAENFEDLKMAVPVLEWACNKANSSGILPEQLHPLTGEPRGVSPLTWSHATVVATVQEYIERYKALQLGSNS